MIAFDASSSGVTAPGASPLSFNHTVSSGLNRLLLVATLDAAASITGVTYNGVAMTQLATITFNGSNVMKIWGLLNPAAGTHAVTISWSGGSTYVRGISQSYTGVLQTGLPDATATVGATTTVSSLPLAITTVKVNCWVAGFFYGNSVGTIQSANANLTLRTILSSLIAFGDSNAKVPVGSFTQTVNWGGSDSTIEHAAVMVSFAPVPDTGMMLSGEI